MKSIEICSESLSLSACHPLIHQLYLPHTFEASTLFTHRNHKAFSTSFQSMKCNTNLAQISNEKCQNMSNSWTNTKTDRQTEIKEHRYNKINT